MEVKVRETSEIDIKDIIEIEKTAKCQVGNLSQISKLNSRISLFSQ